MNTQEIWVDVVGYVGKYKISNLGRVKSLARKCYTKGKYNRNVPERILKQGSTQQGYRIVGLYDTSGKEKIHLIHRLLLENFVGPCPDGYQACHNDGNPLNNSLENLRWDSVKNNMADKIKHGTTNRGTKNGNNKLKRLEVLQIRNLFESGVGAKSISEKFGVNIMTVYDINRRRSWAWL